MRNKILYIYLLFATSVSAGCKKLAQVDGPVTSLNSTNVYSSDATAIAAVTGIYSSISNNGPYNAELDGMSGLAGLSADELTLYPGVSGTALNLYYTNALTNNDNQQDFWLNVYPLIYIENAAIEGLTGATSLTPAVRQQLLGEARFDRAFCYFYLVNLYGDVPLVLTSNYSINATLARTPATQVWQQIVDDLHDAESLLSANYLDGTLLQTATDRVRPTKWAAIAMLARAYLYTGNWTGADSAASVVIGNSQYSLTALDSVFLENSNEAIWQLEPVTSNGFDTEDAFSFILPSSGPDNYQHFAYLNNTLVNAFEANDQRRQIWVDSVIANSTVYYFPFKYQNASNGAQFTEYTMVLRLAEQFLIRAEAEVQLNNLAMAINDLNAIRQRANLAGTNATTPQDILNAILRERRVELFTEWGHRWLDMKRTPGMVDLVMGTDSACAQKGGIWNTNWQWYPIPLTELQADPNLIQNNGY